MRQVAQNYRSGELVVLETPEPTCRAGGILVRTLFSLISTGTELMKVREASLSLVGKARARPDQVRKLVDSVAQQGARATYSKAMDRLDSYTPMGYSTCGVVVEVGEGVDEYAPGDLVACAGNEFALHADVNWVPKNLCVPVPAGVEPEHAAFATVGAIAMQGLRRAEAQIGESACVIGLGLIGQLLTRLLVANGVRVVGIDPVESRRDLALKAGAVACGDASADGLAAFEADVANLTGGLGVDHVFLVAGSDSNEPVETAVRIARDRGRIVDIGKTRLDLPWNDYYEKEIEVRFSRSYGPGRYDDAYELDGVDYPPGYVRWTERRNLACFLDLIATGDLDLAPLASGTFPVGEAAEVYERLGSGSLTGVGYLFAYGGNEAPPAPIRTANPPLTGAREGTLGPRARTPVHGPVRLGFIGAGNYATSMLLPHLARADDVTLARVATSRSLSSVNAQRKFNFDAAGTDSRAVLEDESIDAVFVVTRHHSHADFVCRALRAGKAVFVEKPLALSEVEVARVLETVAETGNDRVMVGFNRRFAPLFATVRDGIAAGEQQAIARYLVNAGQLAIGSWYSNEALEGTRFAGEGGHFIDALSALVSDLPTQVFANAAGGGQDLDIQLRFGRGSIGSITYTTNGNARFPKETLDVSSAGRSARLDNFQRASVWHGRRRTGKRAIAGQDKGQASMLTAFLRAVRVGAPMPIALESIVATTRATFAVAESISSSQPVSL